MASSPNTNPAFKQIGNSRKRSARNQQTGPSSSIPPAVTIMPTVIASAPILNALKPKQTIDNLAEIIGDVPAFARLLINSDTNNTNNNN